MPNKLHDAFNQARFWLNLGAGRVLSTSLIRDQKRAMCFVGTDVHIAIFAKSTYCCRRLTVPAKMSSITPSTSPYLNLSGHSLRFQQASTFQILYEMPWVTRRYIILIWRSLRPHTSTVHWAISVQTCIAPICALSLNIHRPMTDLFRWRRDEPNATSRDVC